jgi:hypothetical protein
LVTNYELKFANPALIVAAASLASLVDELASARHRKVDQRTHFPRISQGDIITMMSRRLGRAE